MTWSTNVTVLALNRSVILGETSFGVRAKYRLQWRITKTMTRRLEKIAVAAIIALTVLVGVYSYNTPSVPPTALGCITPHGYVLITAGLSGFNGSVNHLRPWPVVTVQKGDTVNLFVCNDDRVSVHGFAIDHYLNAGVTLRSGESFRVSFVADRGGNFTIFCNIFCPVHPFMIGQLRVTS